MIAALVAVLALAGAPADTPFTCQPAPLIVNGREMPDALGVTRWASSGFATRIEVRPVACAALLIASASAAERARLEQLNPRYDFAASAGTGLLVALHEATHVALGSTDECRVERTAMAKLPQLLELLPAVDRYRATSAATALDASFRPANGC